jgi:hypothetical protein
MPINLYGTDFYVNILYIMHILNDISVAYFIKYFSVKIQPAVKNSKV